MVVEHDITNLRWPSVWMNLLFIFFFVFPREQFNRFLVVSPLVVSRSPVDENDPDKSYKVPYGSYHQLYRLDGKLIAVCGYIMVGVVL